MKARLYLLLLCFCLVITTITGQISFEARVLDAVSKSPVAFAAVGIKHSSKGCLCNEDGLFKLQNINANDTLVISNVAYRKLELPVSLVLSNPTILLTPYENQLQEVIIYQNNIAYDLFELCRKRLVDDKEQHCKTYFVLESEIGEQPVELLECYYNAKLSSTEILDLGFKNGRVALAPYGSRYFVNRNTSRAISFISLTNNNEKMPVIPFQFGKRQLKKNYKLSVNSIIQGPNPTYQITFEPLNDAGSFFSGEVWIEKNSGILKKINLIIEKTNTHPFLPFTPEYAKIEGVSMQIVKSFTDYKNTSVPDYLYFNYQINYHHFHNTTFVNSNNDTTFKVSSKGVMYFYDYNNLFTLPYFDYDKEAEDYRKITSLTFNNWFWNSNNVLAYSDERKKKINYFKNNGLLFNYRNQNPTKNLKPNSGFFENNYIQWSGKKRLSLKKDGIKNDTLSNSKVDQQFLSQRYKLQAQIFLDVNTVGDSMQHYSTTIFDVYESFYNLPEEPATNCFINIYFDLVEIERQKMESVLSKNKFTVSQIDSLHKNTLKNIELISNDYFSKVSRGKNLPELEKWNNIVLQNLGINNLELFAVKEKINQTKQ